MHVPILTMGALSDGELELALEAGSEVAVWEPALPGGGRGARAGAGHHARGCT